MASIGHIALGMAAARLDQKDRRARWGPMLAWSAVSMLPDSDVIGFSLGVPYGAPWGHRGATHSVTFAIVAGLAIGAAARLINRPVLRTSMLAILLLASHAFLDTLTDGGLGCALFWPFDLTRYFAPWRPIQVAPIGLAFFSPYGAVIAMQELVLFAPAIILSLRTVAGPGRSRAHAVWLLVWLPLAWLIASNDRMREAVVGLLLREDTSYSQGFSEAAFLSLASGQSEEEVRRRLGFPHGESWIYASREHPSEPAESASAASLANECITLHFESGVLKTALDRDACRKLAVGDGASIVDVRRLLGPPTEKCWHYTWSPGNQHFRMRMVCFLDGRVGTVFRQWN
jgi:inner membrane protein